MGSGLANGKDVGDVGLDVVMSVTNADLAGEAIDYVAAPAVEAMEKSKNTNKKLLEECEEINE